MIIRESFEAREHEILSPHAAFSDESRGRDHFEEKCDLRTDYQRDRDRIIHCKSFRRLKHKTQVFLAPSGDHYRTRLTHTLEVSQIARSIAKALRLNEDLTEAIALGHDLGHTPFGHAGERALSRCTKKYADKAFRHNEQSVRVVEALEKSGKGLNLTWEVRDGILNHQTAGKPATLEGNIVRLSDKIAYINHDIDDGIRAGLMTEESLPETCTEILGHSTRDRINTLVHGIVSNSLDREVVSLPEEQQKALYDLRAFMFSDLYTNPVAKGEEVKAEKLITMLFEAYMEDIDKLPEKRAELIKAGSDKVTVITDYIAGMTDNYAVECAKELFLPMSWQRA
ncbi:MAG: deoxyguanosinetriphosphate triphosphohydrolase [Lachnospiraceae bacterium]|nr:deoxyguanosinetriphosphate triphosphohydrolase [Lachnospiraceae bacterium]